MSEIQVKIDEATTRLLAVDKEIVDLERSALAHETQARADRNLRAERKDEAKELRAVLVHSQMIKHSQSALDVAEQSRADAAKANTDAQALHAQAADTLAALKLKEDELAKLIEANKPKEQ